MLHGYTFPKYYPKADTVFLYQKNGTFVRGFLTIEELDEYVTSLGKTQKYYEVTETRK